MEPSFSLPTPLGASVSANQRMMCTADLGAVLIMASDDRFNRGRGGAGLRGGGGQVKPSSFS